MSQQTLHIESIRPPAYKLRDDIGDLEPLKGSMKRCGLLEPIIVRPINLGKNYQVVAGHRRYLAAIELGWTEIAASVRDVDDRDALEISLIENLDRKTIDVIEEATAFYKYTNEYGYGSISELAPRISRSVQYISSRLSLLKLPKDAFEGVRTGKLTTSHGEVLSTLDAEKAEELTRIITSEATGKPYLDVEQTRKAVGLVRRGADAQQAAELVIQHPEWDLHKEHTPFDPIKTARETMPILLQKALDEMDSNINRLVDGEEKAKWVNIRYELHQLLDRAMKLAREYRKK